MRKGDWIQTYTGGRFWPLDPRPQEVFIEDIAHALSLLCRFTGHCEYFYSVAQHSVLVSELFPTNPAMALWGLLHDAPEAYLGDISRPVKPYLFRLEQRKGEPIGKSDAYHINCVEADIMEAIAQALELTPGPDWDRIKHADNVLLATEARDLMSPLVPDWRMWIKDVPTLPSPIESWSPEMAESRFLRRYHELKESR